MTARIPLDPEPWVKDGNRYPVERHRAFGVADYAPRPVIFASTAPESHKNRDPLPLIMGDGDVARIGGDRINLTALEVADWRRRGKTIIARPRPEFDPVPTTHEPNIWLVQFRRDIEQPDTLGVRWWRDQYVGYILNPVPFGDMLTAAHARAVLSRLGNVDWEGWRA